MTVHTSAQKPKAAQQTASARSATLGRDDPGQCGAVDPVLRLQRTAGNQAVLRLLQTHVEDPDGGFTAALSPRLGHDVSRIAIPSPRPSVMQTKLATNQPGDIYEQEADRISEQVMATLAHHAVNGAPPPIQRLAGQPIGRAEAAPPSVDQALASPGRPLEPTLRQDMEQRFGHDFSRVRVHSGAAAQRSAQDVSAQAYTVRHNIVFGAGRFQPGTHEGRRLLAHELTHVIQQSRSAGNVPQLQRDDPKPGSAAAKLETAKDNLKAKYGLKDISERGGVAWTERQLKRIDATFAKMSSDEQKRLRGVTLVLVDKFPSKTLKGKTFPIVGTTFGTFQVELTSVGVREAVLHEAGHLIHNTAIANAKKLFDRSPFKANLETARSVLDVSSKQRFRVSADETHIFNQFKTLLAAAEAFERSGDDDRAANRASLEEAEMSLLTLLPFSSSPDAQALSAHADTLRAFVATLLRWSDEREKVVGPVMRLDEFVSIVKTHRLARRSFPAFTSYAAANWPDKPAEFFAEAYDSWRKKPADMKRTGRALFEWFEKGGHLGPKLPPP